MNALYAAIERLAVEVPVLPARTLLTLACDEHNDTVAYDQRVSEHDQPELLARIQIRYVQEQLVETDRALEETVTRCGDSAAQAAFQAQILTAIADAYPELAEACAELIFLDR